MAYDRRILAVSVALQLVLGTLFGHAYDARVSLATGYLVGTGHGPYSPLDLTAVFQHAGFEQLTTIGYPPPWPLVTGLIYRATYALVPNLIVYDLALKLPLIAATIGLAYLVGAALRRLGAQAATCRRAWAFLLLNPLILFTGAAWGQIDVHRHAAHGRRARARVAREMGELGRAAGAGRVHEADAAAHPARRPGVAGGTGAAGGAPLRAPSRPSGRPLFLVVPVVVLGWRTAQIWHRPNAHFLMTGGMSYTTVARLFRDPLSLPGHWWLLGMLWVVALAVGLVLLRRGPGFEDLVRGAVALVLVFLLTRAWLAEPNVVLVLPLALILVSLDRLDRRLLTALWLIPLAFAVANLAPLQLLWLAFPAAWHASLTAAADFSSVSLALRAALVVAWQVAGWWTVVACLRPRRGGAAVVNDAAGAPC